MSTLGAIALPLLAPTASLAQTPLEVEESVDQAQTALDRAVDDVLRVDASGNEVGVTDASFGPPVLSQDTESEAIGVPSEGFFFSDDEPRAFWRSTNGRRIVHPVSAPSYNDDAYVTSDVRGHYINHQFPNNGTTSGGALRNYGLQVRYAVDEAFQLQLTKFGFTDLHLNGRERDDSDDIAIAAKYAFLQDWENQTHASIGVGYELGVGDNDTFASDDEFRVFGAFNQGFDRSHVGLSVNLAFATGDEDNNGTSDRLSAHLHYDYEWNDSFSPLVELNYYSVLSDGDPVTPFSGLDLGNLGGNEDEDALSAALGGEFRFQRDLAVRLAYESPLTDNVDLWGYRWTASAIWRF